jgi:hypothetical protein
MGGFLLYRPILALIWALLKADCKRFSFLRETIVKMDFLKTESLYSPSGQCALRPLLICLPRVCLPQVDGYLFLPS